MTRDIAVVVESMKTLVHNKTNDKTKDKTSDRKRCREVDSFSLEEEQSLDKNPEKEEKTGGQMMLIQKDVWKHKIRMFLCTRDLVSFHKTCKTFHDYFHETVEDLKKVEMIRKKYEYQNDLERDEGGEEGEGEGEEEG